MGGYVKYALIFFYCVLYILPVFASYWWNLWAHQLESIARFLCLHFKFLFCNGWCRASDISRDYDGACLQMRMSYSPAAHLFLFLVQWTDCHLAGALGLLRILIYKVELCSFGWDCTFFPPSINRIIENLVVPPYLRFMWMAQPPWLLMKEKQVSGSSMVNFCLPIIFVHNFFIIHLS